MSTERKSDCGGGSERVNPLVVSLDIARVYTCNYIIYCDILYKTWYCSCAIVCTLYFAMILKYIMCVSFQRSVCICFDPCTWLVIHNKTQFLFQIFWTFLYCVLCSVCFFFSKKCAYVRWSLCMMPWALDIPQTEEILWATAAKKGQERC